MRKCAVLLLVMCLVVSSLSSFIFIPATVQAASKPSVPQFSVNLVDNSYDVPQSSTTTVDQYTGEKITTTTPGYHIDQRAIVVTIKNQPFTSYTDKDGKMYKLYYHIQVKGHFGDEWKDFQETIFQSDSAYTFNGDRVSAYGDGAQLDFRVEAIIGYLGGEIGYSNADEAVLSVFVPYYPIAGFTPRTYTDAVSSGWSEVQSFTIPKEASQLAPSQTTTLPENSIIISNGNQTTSIDSMSYTKFLLGIIVFLLCVIASLVVLFLRRQTKTFDINNDASSHNSVYTESLS